MPMVRKPSESLMDARRKQVKDSKIIPVEAMNVEWIGGNTRTRTSRIFDLGRLERAIGQS